jgi:Uma2 family endonuclease
MVMAATIVDWTVDMLDELPDDGRRYEIIDGELFVTPSPRDVHQLVVGEVYARLCEYLRGSGVGKRWYRRRMYVAVIGRGTGCSRTGSSCA